MRKTGKIVKSISEEGVVKAYQSDNKTEKERAIASFKKAL